MSRAVCTKALSEGCLAACPHSRNTASRSSIPHAAAVSPVNAAIYPVSSKNQVKPYKVADALQHACYAQQKMAYVCKLKTALNGLHRVSASQQGQTLLVCIRNSSDLAYCI